MEKNSYLKIVNAIAQDIIEIPGYNTMKTIWEIMLGKVNDTKKLFKEIFVDCSKSVCELSSVQKEELNLCVYNIFQYAMQGRAKENLKLLIRMLKGLVEVSANDIYTEGFHKYSSLLSSLTKKEIILLGTIYQSKKKISYKDFKNPALIPNVFKNEYEIQATKQALIRTGLFMINVTQGQIVDHEPDMEAPMFGLYSEIEGIDIEYQETNLMTELGNLIDFTRIADDFINEGTN
jgi:hypothetical protein